jgi:hypothetical protein
MGWFYVFCEFEIPMKHLHDTDTQQWGSSRIITLVTIGGLLMMGFVLVQALLPKTATIAPRIVKQRSVLAAACASFCTGSQLMVFGRIHINQHDILRC